MHARLGTDLERYVNTGSQAYRPGIGTWGLALMQKGPSSRNLGRSAQEHRTLAVPLCWQVGMRLQAPVMGTHPKHISSDKKTCVVGSQPPNTSR